MDKHLKIMKMIFERIVSNVDAIDRTNVITNEMADVDWDHYDEMLNDDEPTFDKEGYEIISKMLMTDIKRMTRADEPTGSDILTAMGKLSDDTRTDVVAMTFTDDEIKDIKTALTTEQMFLAKYGSEWSHIDALLKRFDR